MSAMQETSPWQAFDAELSRWQAAGRVVEFWWRDDDATARTPALDRLFALSAARGVPLALAVIPARADATLFGHLPQTVDLLQHGCDHGNRADAGAKKSEFPAGEAVEPALERIRRARERLESLSGGRALPVLAPPWNRLHGALAARLAETGVRGLSRFQARAPAAAAGVVEVNTHVDLIDWRGHRGFAGTTQVLHQACAHLEARRTARVDATEPTGWLSHHAVHDAPAWAFLDELFARTAEAPAVRWRRAAALFQPVPGV
ncbi:MAG: polysaccharide deacetylase family protein [Proteobacteria bacterium]|nr:polysaccharide deacetylase family protein [Pseudomonadota bacterium]